MPGVKRKRGAKRGAGALVPVERVTRSILLIRGQKVLLDIDLATLYDVEVRTLNQAVKRNADRFPKDFMFQLTLDEAISLRSQLVISNSRGGRRYRPYAFTEHGAVMLASVLRSPTAVDVSVPDIPLY
jgi:ORF6N domain